MGKGTKEFMGETKGGSGEILKWKDDGSIVGFIHPDGFHSRRVYWISYIKEDDEGEKELVREPFICPGLEKGCPICQLREFLKVHEDIEDDEVVYSVGKKKKKVEILKGDALNLKDYDWRLSLIPSREFLFGFVDSDNPEAGVSVLIASAGLGRAISTCIENRMEDVGDEEGDPLKNPWALKLRYKEKATPSNKYKAFYNSAELTKKIKKLLESDAPSIANLTSTSKPSEIWAIIEDGMQLEGFDPDIPDDDDDDDDEELKTKKKKKKRKVKEEGSKKEKKKVKHDDDEDEEEEEETSSKKKKKKLKIKKKKKVKDNEGDDEEEETEPCPQCGKEIPLSATKCKGCGIEFVLDSDEEEDEEEEEEEEETLKCEYCGEQIKKGKKRCPECGEKL